MPKIFYIDIDQHDTNIFCDKIYDSDRYDFISEDFLKIIILMKMKEKFLTIINVLYHILMIRLISYQILIYWMKNFL